MAIIPLRAEFENFLCFQEKQEFVFEHSGIHYIYGIDLDADITEGFTQEQYNIGVGKSSLAMLMEFAFYGKIQKKINIDQIINKFTKKNLYVQFDFMINNEIYRIERYRKHDYFNNSLFLYKKINGEFKNISLADKKQTQQEINKLIVLDMRTFEKSVLFTRDDKIQFLELPIIERGNVFENIIQINRLQNYLDKVKRKLKNVDEELTFINNKILTISTVIKRDKEYIEEIKQNYNKQIVLINSKINELKEQINCICSLHLDNIKPMVNKYNELLNLNSNLTNELNILTKNLNNKINEQSDISHKINKLNNLIIKLNNKLSSLQPIKCRICGAIQNEDEYNTALLELKREIEYNNKEIIKLEKYLYEVNQIIAEHEDKIIKFNIILEQNEKQINELKQQIPQLLLENPSKIDELNQLYEQLNLYNLQLQSINIDEQINNLNNNIKINSDKLNNYQQQKNELMLKRKMLEFWSNVLDFKNENSLKQYIISKIIPLFNILLQQIVDAVYFGDLTIIFDNFFQETIIYKNEDTKYDELSTGEKAKLNFCIYLAIFDLTRINLDGSKVIFLDEIFNNIDKPTIVNFLNIIKERYAKDNSVYIISHQSEVKENLNPNSIIRIEKQNNASKIFVEKNILN